MNLVKELAYLIGLLLKDKRGFQDRSCKRMKSRLTCKFGMCMCVCESACMQVCVCMPAHACM